MQQQRVQGNGNISHRGHQPLGSDDEFLKEMRAGVFPLPYPGFIQVIEPAPYPYHTHITL